MAFSLHKILSRYPKVSTSLLPARDPKVSVTMLADASLAQGLHRPTISYRTPNAHLALSARLIEGHPDDIEDLMQVLKREDVRKDLVMDVVCEDHVLDNESIKILSAVFVVDPASVAKYTENMWANMGPVVRHKNLLIPQSAHAKMALFQSEPSLEDILRRHWRQPFHGHDHSPSTWKRIKSFFKSHTSKAPADV